MTPSWRGALRVAWRLLRVCAVPPSRLGGPLRAHLRAHGHLAAAEVAAEWALWRQPLLWRAAGWLAACFATGFAGVALMLWAAWPAAPPQAPWVLLAVPLFPALVAGVCLWKGRAPAPRVRFPALRRQWSADLALLRGRPSAAAEPDAVDHRRVDP